MSEEYREQSQELIFDREDYSILQALEDGPLSLGQIGELIEEVDTELGYSQEDLTLTDRISQAVERLTEKGKIETTGAIIRKI